MGARIAKSTGMGHDVVGEAAAAETARPAPRVGAASEEGRMSVEANKTALRRAVGNFSTATLDAYLQLYHPQAVLHFLPPGLPQGRQGAQLFYQGFLAAFPDAQITLEDFVSEDDKVAARFTLEGTHRGEFMGVPATGTRITLSGITILRFVDGQCVERWNEANFLALLQQLGAVPA
jgi:steroid delta-isomerase-like uncharacterized protein